MYKISPITKRFLLTLIILLATFFRLHQIQTLPPGDGFDPAYYGLDALRILGGESPIYLSTNYGREVLFSYLVAAVYAVVGSGTLGIHLASALVAVLTISTIYLATNELFKQEKLPVFSQFGGLLAALIMALSFWHLMWSRYSVRVILIPFFISLLCFFLLRAFRTRQWLHFFLAGIVMGISSYTYPLAQLFPILVGLGFVCNWVARRSFGKRETAQLLLVYGTAFLISLPLAIYVLNHPDVFNQRISDVYVLKDTKTLSEIVQVLATNIWQVIKMYTIEGDSDPMINIPGRPSLNPFLSLAFLAGTIAAVWRWRRSHYFFLLLWLGLMSSPAFLATKAAMSKRALGALPATATLIALALLWPLAWWQNRQQIAQPERKWPYIVYTAVLLFGLIFTAATTYRDFFITWASDPDLETHYKVGVAEIGEYIAALPATETVYLSPTWLDHATLKLHADNRDDIHAYNGRHCFVYPQETAVSTTYVIVPGDEKNSLPLLESAFPDGLATEDGFLSNGNPYFVSYRIDANSLAQIHPQYPVTATWGSKIAFYGYDLAAQAYQPGETITINLYYGALADMGINYTIFLHLRSPADPETGHVLWGQVDRDPCFQSYPTASWHVGEIIRDSYTLTVDPNASAWTYSLMMGIYQWPDLIRLDAASTSHMVMEQMVLLQEIQVE